MASDTDEGGGAETMRSFVSRADRSHVLVQPAMGATLLLSGGERWAREGARAAFELWLAQVRRESLRCYATSTDAAWHAVEPMTIERLDASLPLPWARHAVRHSLRVRVADRPEAPSVAFTYCELDERRAPCAGYLQCVLPQETPPEALTRLLWGLLGCGAVHWAVAGAFAAVSVTDPVSSYAALRALCRRYVGVDVQDPELAASVREPALPSAGWLTVVGAPLLGRRPDSLERLRSAAPRHGVTVHEGAGGVAVRAGSAPTVGDLNQLVFPHAYAEAAYWLEPFFAEEFPAFKQWKPAVGRAWRRRFLEPEGWR